MSYEHTFYTSMGSYTLRPYVVCQVGKVEAIRQWMTQCTVK
jgi:hypothetical protein